MRGRAETKIAIAASESKEKLVAWVDSFRVPDYKETDESNFHFPGQSYTWNKYFAKDSPMEPFNVPTDEDYIDIGTEQDAAREAVLQYRNFIKSLVEVD
jgi:hypothetical protein